MRWVTCSCLSFTITVPLLFLSTTALTFLFLSLSPCSGDSSSSPSSSLPSLFALLLCPLGPVIRLWGLINFFLLLLFLIPLFLQHPLLRFFLPCFALPPIATWKRPGLCLALLAIAATTLLCSTLSFIFFSLAYEADNETAQSSPASSSDPPSSSTSSSSSSSSSSLSPLTFLYLLSTLLFFLCVRVLTSLILLIVDLLFEARRRMESLRVLREEEAIELNWVTMRSWQEQEEQQRGRGRASSRGTGGLTRVEFVSLPMFRVGCDYVGLEESEMVKKARNEWKLDNAQVPLLCSCENRIRVTDGGEGQRRQRSGGEANAGQGERKEEDWEMEPMSGRKRRNAVVLDGPIRIVVDSESGEVQIRVEKEHHASSGGDEGSSSACSGASSTPARRCSDAAYIRPQLMYASRSASAQATLAPPPSFPPRVDSTDCFSPSSRCHPNMARCSICLSAFRAHELVTILPCDHMFHRDACLMNWVKKKAQCPLCRQPVIRTVGAQATGSRQG